ncbi:MAG TPA: ABC transporter permease, partial [Thermoanaerobaculia bacterium]|nr:ABC transporter permease [Thermoanaerobaculia bacterium]
MKDVLKQLARDLKAEKLRTFLTIFGIVWGTVAISLMLAFGTGLHKQLIKSTAGLGDRIVIAWPGLT